MLFKNPVCRYLIKENPVLKKFSIYNFLSNFVPQFLCKNHAIQKSKEQSG